MISQTCLTAPTGVPLAVNVMLCAVGDVCVACAEEAAAGRDDASDAAAASPTTAASAFAP